LSKQHTYRNLFLLLVICIGAHVNLFAQTTQVTRILFVVDASRSMSQTWDRSAKMVAARTVVNGIADSLNDNPNIQMAMRVYGHQSPQPLNDCEDSKLEIGFRTKNGLSIKNRLDDIRPNGVTPIAYSMEQTLTDFGPDAKNYRNILILVSDGFESCGKNPCEVVQRLRNLGVITKSYVIGIGIDATEFTQFSCMGEFMNIESEQKTEQVIDATIAKIFNSVYVKVDLLDTYNQPKETDVLMTFYDATSDVQKFNYYHTINPKGNPDTITLDPALNYDMQVHTTPELMKKDIELTPGKINTITQPAPQGYLVVDVRNEKFVATLNCIIKKDNKIVTWEQTNKTRKLLTGNYDVEILTLPIITVKNVKVEQDKTTTLEIAAPGFATISKTEAVSGGIYEYRENKLVEIYELNEASLKETLTIQPGKYKIIYRYLSKKDMDATKEIDFEITSGASFTIRL
jgi:Ca-activated chloride channel family protein